MNRRQGFLALAGVLALAVTFGVWRMLEAARTREQAVQSALAACAGEIGRRPRDRDALQNELRRVEELSRAGSDARLVVARARLEHALGRAQAWDTIAGLALSPAAGADELLAAAEIVAARFYVSGKDEDSGRALELVERCLAAGGDSRAALLGWQLASKAGRSADAARFAGVLEQQFGGSPAARLVLALQRFDPVQPESTRALEALEAEFDDPPAELQLALAMHALQSAEPGTLDDGLRRLESVLTTHAAWIELRNAAAVAFHKRGRQPERDHHLRWLLQNAPADDPRRSTWSQLLDQPLR
jgi:hypothetical protein